MEDKYIGWVDRGVDWQDWPFEFGLHNINIKDVDFENDPSEKDGEPFLSVEIQFNGKKAQIAGNGQPPVGIFRISEDDLLKYMAEKGLFKKV